MLTIFNDFFEHNGIDYSFYLKSNEIINYIFCDNDTYYYIMFGDDISIIDIFLIYDYFEEKQIKIRNDDIKISDIKDFEITDFDKLEEYEKTLKYYQNMLEIWYRKYKIKNLLK